MTHIVVIGIGNEMRGDDAAGLEVARRLIPLSQGRFDVIESDGAAGQLIEAWKDAHCVILVDAMFSGGPPGSVRRFDLLKEVLPRSILRSSSTHDFGVAQAVELSRSLHQLPKRLVLFAIEGKCFGLGADVSPAAEEAVRQVVQSIQLEFYESNFRS